MIKNVLNLFSGRFIGGLALIFADFGLRAYTLKEVSRHRLGLLHPGRADRAITDEAK